jgi:hypothetical protein
LKREGMVLLQIRKEVVIHQNGSRCFRDPFWSNRKIQTGIAGIQNQCLSAERRRL